MKWPCRACRKRYETPDCPVHGLRPAKESHTFILRMSAEYGSLARAGSAYDERFGLRPGAGERLMERLLNGQARVLPKTLDRLETLFYS